MARRCWSSRQAARQYPSTSRVTKPRLLLPPLQVCIQKEMLEKKEGEERWLWTCVEDKNEREVRYFLCQIHKIIVVVGLGVTGEEGSADVIPKVFSA
jgi:hypothetical protein